MCAGRQVRQSVSKPCSETEHQRLGQRPKVQRGSGFRTPTAPRCPGGGGHHREVCSRHAAATNGTVLARAREEKERKYVELRTRSAADGANNLWVFVDSLASARAREAPSVLRRSVRLSWRRRWSLILSVSCARASRLHWSPFQPWRSLAPTERRQTWPTSSSGEEVWRRHRRV